MSLTQNLALLLFLENRVSSSLANRYKSHPVLFENDLHYITTNGTDIFYIINYNDYMKDSYKLTDGLIRQSNANEDSSIVFYSNKVDSALVDRTILKS